MAFLKLIDGFDVRFKTLAWGWLLFLLVSPVGVFARSHAVIVVGTQHYSPERSMPLFAEELERFGFEVTLVMGEGDPEEKNVRVLPGIEALADADVAIFFMRFLTLDEYELRFIHDYVTAGKPVVGLSTSTHSFKYPEGHRFFEWNDGFGRRAMGTPYIVHQRSDTECTIVSQHQDHPILSHVGNLRFTSPGTLYLTRLEPGCIPLVTGKGEGRSRLVEKSSGTVMVNEEEQDIVAWAWENEWGGKVFGTSFGHPGDFADKSIVRILVNGVCWAAEQSLPTAETTINTWKIQRNH